MPGGRPISGSDVRAAPRLAPAIALDRGALEAMVAEHDLFADYAELARRCPAAALGISSVAHAALFGPLFGEFE